MQAIAPTTLSARDRDRALSFLRETSEEFRRSVTGLTDAQWKFKPHAGSWSIAGVVEHIALLEQRLESIIAMTGELKDPLTTPAEAMDEIIFQQVSVRESKVQAPERVHPQERWSGPEALEVFLSARKKNEQLLDIPGLRDRYFTHPLFGPWDGYQWVIGGAAHSRRHAAQIREIRSSAGFPES